MFSGVAIAGCAGTGGVFTPSEPKKIGDDSYIISIESTSIGIADKKVALFNQANAHCASMDKRMERIAANQNKGGTIGDFVLDLEYKCLPK